ncbi:hypothetical protein ACHAXT_013293, partial [Thalassiosira profunda]
SAKFPGRSKAIELDPGVVDRSAGGGGPQGSIAAVQPKNEPDEGADDTATRSSKIVSIKSTPDGDIQTVEETTKRRDSGNDSVEAFTHHLRDSWDENDDATDGPRTRHKQNLSVQFHDFSISGDVDATTLETQQQPQRAAKKETIEGSATYYFNRSSPAPDAAPTEDGTQGFLDSTVLEFSAEDLPRDVESSFEEQQPLSDAVDPSPVVFHPPPAPGVGLSPILSPGASDDGEQNEGGAGSLSLGGSGVSRKHRRVFSGRSNPAMAHRRVNTRGDKCAPTREFRIEADADEDTEGQQQRGKKAFTGGAPPNEQDLQGLSPGTAAMPPPQPVPPQPQQAPQQQPHPPYYSGTPPSSYDPYGGYQQPPPQAPYQQGTPPPPPPAYYGASLQSDAGVSYGARASPVGSVYPPQTQRYQQYPPAAPGGYYPNARPPPGRRGSNTSAGSSGYSSGGGPYQPPPPNLDQPSLESRVSGYAGEMLARRSANGAASNGAEGEQHHREPSFNPLPFQDSEKGSHHRKQSSLGNFLATTNIFEEADIFVEDEGYASAPEERRCGRKITTRDVSSMSFMRSLSSDDLLRQIHDDQRREVQPWQQQQPVQPQYPPQPSPPSSGPPPPYGYPPQHASPCGLGPWIRADPTRISDRAVRLDILQLLPATISITALRRVGRTPSIRGLPLRVCIFPPPPSPTQGAAYNYGPPQMYQPQQQMPPAPPQLHQYGQPPPPPMGYGAAPHPPPQCQQQPKQPQPKSNAVKGRRKCSHERLPETASSSAICSPSILGMFLVQGGLCIAHGANRKKCGHPGCTKNVKKAGFCSAHGPARKRCEAEGCTKVAVQGGRCIAHGAKKKVCAYEGCQKQAILKGYCKRHHDEVNGIVKVRGAKKGGAAKTHTAKAESGGHQRGLSMFQDEDLMDAIYNNNGPAPAEDDGLRGLSIE